MTGDKDLILRIGSNLLSNAVKFTEHGMISLSVVYQNDTFAMTVEDTGSGISEEQQERIYRPFERLTNAATQDGFGLGLTIVRELVELMKGELSLDSVPGKGAVSVYGCLSDGRRTPPPTKAMCLPYNRCATYPH